MIALGISLTGFVVDADKVTLASYHDIVGFVDGCDTELDFLC
jgi:hypothetical protein